MLWSCCHGSFILKGPFPIGMSLKALLSASPADAGTGLIDRLQGLLVELAVGGRQLHPRVLASGADRPLKVSALAGGAPSSPLPWMASYPSIPAMW